jgi:2-methylisocitrate lyase-like PEP mutase family enzyme
MTSSSTLSAPRRFRALLERAGPMLLPGVYDALTARIVEDVGFDGVYLGGFAAGAANLGVPDHSLITMTEILDVARRITSAVDVPVIADLDDAGGNAVNVGRFVRLAERAGLAGVHIEDVVAGKHFGSHPDAYAGVRTFADRIRAATDARDDADFVIVARSDTRGVEEMIERSLAAADAGADMIFLPHLRRRDVERVQQACSVPMMQIGTSRTPAADSGAKVVIFPGDILFAAFDAARETAVRLRGGVANALEAAVYTDLNRIIGSPEATSAAERYGVVPPMAPQ